MKRKPAAEGALQDRIGYVFQDAALLTRALTHSSARDAAGPDKNYQRLEFLGDRVLGLAVADLLIRTYPRASEGELSQRLAELVRAATCADVARQMGVECLVQRGGGAGRQPGRVTPAMLADVCEAVIGAVYLDGGHTAAAALVERFWRDLLVSSQRPLRDPKTALQEWAQGQGLPPPLYREVERTGPHHDPRFRVSVDVPNHSAAEGVGRSKQAAEQAAAAAMLAREGLAPAPQ